MLLFFNCIGYHTNMHVSDFHGGPLPLRVRPPFLLLKPPPEPIGPLKCQPSPMLPLRPLLLFLPLLLSVRPPLSFTLPLCSSSPFAPLPCPPSLYPPRPFCRLPSDSIKPSIPIVVLDSSVTPTTNQETLFY